MEPDLNAEGRPPAANANGPVTGRYGWLRPSHQHTAFSATLLLMASSLLSGVMGLVRQKYIAYVFGAGAQTDAYNAAFELPDMINYFLIGGVASITFVTILSRYREAGQEEEGDRALSAVLNAMLVVLTAGVVLAEIFAPLYTHYKFPGFNANPAQAALCTSLTRILLPAQLFFFAGGVLGSRLLVRKFFAYQALTPLIYNAGIIAGGLLLARRMGVHSLAIGALAGALLGPFLLNGWGALRTGMRYWPRLDFNHPALKEWLRLSVPLMLGVSLVTADKWILTYFASHDTGGITRLTFAKTLFTAPMSIIGQAAGAASLPFFASLYSQGKGAEFAAAINRSVSRMLAVSLLLSALMIALARPAVDLIFRGGSFHRADASATALYFAVFSLSLALWAAQAIYARGFYAAGDTLTPMVAGTIITLASLPVYWALFHTRGLVGLAIASDLGILTHTLVLALLLHMRKLASLAGLEGMEILRVVLAAAVSFVGIRLLLQHGHFSGGYGGDGIVIAAGTLLWVVLGGGTLLLLRSRLPGELMGRFWK